MKDAGGWNWIFWGGEGNDGCHKEVGGKGDGSGNKAGVRKRIKRLEVKKRKMKS